MIQSLKKCAKTNFYHVESFSNIHRACCECELTTLVDSVMSKLDISDSSKMKLAFVDNDGDIVVLSSDECFIDAVEVARRSKSESLKASIELESVSITTVLAEKDNNIF